MGLGGALFEAIQLRRRARSSTRASPTTACRASRDVPVLETVLLDRKDLPSAGAGETPIVALARRWATPSSRPPACACASLPMAPNGVNGG